jgi:hypothetical protein
MPVKCIFKILTIGMHNWFLFLIMRKFFALQIFHKSIKRSVKAAIVYSKNSKNKWMHKIYFRSDLEQTWQDILEMYRLRF